MNVSFYIAPKDEVVQAVALADETYAAECAADLDVRDVLDLLEDVRESLQNGNDTDAVAQLAEAFFRVAAFHGKR